MLGCNADPGHHLRWPSCDTRPRQDWADLYEELAIDLQELADLGNSVVLAAVLAHGHPVDSSGYLDSREAWVYEGADGMIVRVRTYRDIDEGRAAAERLAEERG